MLLVAPVTVKGLIQEEKGIAQQGIQHTGQHTINLRQGGHWTIRARKGKGLVHEFLHNLLLSWKIVRQVSHSHVELLGQLSHGNPVISLGIE